MTTVYEAFSNVMGEVQGIRKGDRNAQQGFNFRGIDAVLNAVGPALRKHGVIILPRAESIDVERYQTAKGGFMQGVIVRMRYTVLGPEGDSFDGSAYGQASDAGDKAVTKAESVAYRTFLLQALTVPTDEPDPDASSHERATQSVKRRPAKEKIADAVRAIHACTDPAELDRIQEHATRLGIAGVEDVREALADRRDFLGASNVDHWTPTGDVDASPSAPSPVGSQEAWEAAEAARFDSEAGEA